MKKILVTLVAASFLFAIGAKVQTFDHVAAVVPPGGDSAVFTAAVVPPGGDFYYSLV